ncbi:hypothetical protein [Aminobacter sp. HY435]|uniref:hypothetical protein n=1 Tax=Aminobacter sp. HY435 TaxID=2970917 RepID=UPI0022B9B9B4|nr:hypothetical protein [Aminobacter sp. HY435]
MQAKPQNHVTRAMEAAFSGHDVLPELPVLERQQIERLERLYPPRCLGRADTVEEHLRYAGMVEFVANLRARFEQVRTDPEEGDPILDGEPAR